MIAATLTARAFDRLQLFDGGSRYDQRKTYEEVEANAIGTEYLRAGLLPTGAAEKVRRFLKKYLNERIQTVLSGAGPGDGVVFSAVGKNGDTIGVARETTVAAGIERVARTASAAPMTRTATPAGFSMRR